MPETAKLILDGKTYELPVVVGTEGEKAINIARLRQDTGYITLDDSYANTGSCESAITFIDGEKGILRYRGVPIEQIAEKSTFLETAYFLIWGRVPSAAELKKFADAVTESSFLHEGMRHHFEGFPPTAHPMAVLSSMVNAISCFAPELNELDTPERFHEAVVRLLGQIRAIAAYSYKSGRGEPFTYPRADMDYAANFLHMMFTRPYRDHVPSLQASRALDLIFTLHADHEQNCSTSTVRMVGSSKANLFASVAAGICALWGPLHGGANQEVLEMLEHIRSSGKTVKQIVEEVKDRKFLLYGFGHRVYKNFDPRARIIKRSCDEVLGAMGVADPLLDIAKELEAAALQDPYFTERKLYPNVDFYSGIILRALGIPTEFFTVIFAIGRMPGWIANWKEMRDTPKGRIYRPRQIYQGSLERTFEEARKAR
jgi:citrate synthase